MIKLNFVVELNLVFWSVKTFSFVCSINVTVFSSFRQLAKVNNFIRTFLELGIEINTGMVPIPFPSTI
jgi:hypothetical protein